MGKWEKRTLSCLQRTRIYIFSLLIHNNPTRYYIYLADEKNEDQGLSKVSKVVPLWGWRSRNAKPGLSIS